MQGGGHLAVLLFFLVSGFIISHVVDKESRTEFAIKRAFRILPMLFGGVTIAFIVSKLVLAIGLPGPNFSVADVLLSASLLDHVIGVYPQVSSVTWTLVAEIGFYALIVVFYETLARRPMLASYAIISTMLAMQIVLCLAFGDRVPAVFFLKQALFIMVSRAAYLVWSGRASLLAGACLAAAAVAALFASYLLTPYGRSLLFVRDSVAYSWVAAMVIFGAAMALRLRRTPSVVRFLGDISYSTYLLHLSVGGFVMSGLVAKAGMAAGLAIPIAAAAVFALSYVTYLTVEVPFQKLGRYWLRATPLHAAGRQRQPDIVAGTAECEFGPILAHPAQEK
jgi:peptidoglycan/LPS O-acetylase OafA/YrhL